MSALNETSEDGTANGERIAKVIARSGLCSRRDAEVLIGEKRVSVNGAIIESAALDVMPSDKVLVDGRPLAVRQPPRLWRYHKPKGRVTTHKDPEGRPTVFEALPEDLPRLISVGRLDYNTEGLLLLTNDGDLARHLELPSTGWTRRYRVRAYGKIEQAQLDELAEGLRAGGVNYGPIEASLEREQGDNVWITVSIREGKNREVRQIMEHLGLSVNRLIRVSYGPFMLGDLEPGQVEEVKTGVLKDQLGMRLARQLGVKREVAREERRLAPQRAKPTYLRRKPAAEVRPERVMEERPLRRRRIFQNEGEEAKVEFVPDRTKRPGRPGTEAGGEAGRRFVRRGEDRENSGGRDFARPSRPARDRAEGDRAPNGERREFRPRRTEEGRSGGDGPKPFRKRFERSEGDRSSDGERQEFRPRRTEEGRSGGDGPKPFRKRFERPEGDRAPAGEKREFRPRRPEEGRSGSDGPKPFKKRFERSEGDRAPNGEQRTFRPRRTEEGRSGGDGPKPFKKRFERTEGDRAPAGEKREFRPRRTEEGRSGGDGPKPFRKRFERSEGDRSPDGERREFRPRRTEEGRSGGDGPKPFRKRFERPEGDRAPDGEKRAFRPRRTEEGRSGGDGPKPFKKRFERSEGDRAPNGEKRSFKPRPKGEREGPDRGAPARGQGGKPFKSGGDFARKPRPGGPRKPGPKPGETR